MRLLCPTCGGQGNIRNPIIASTLVTVPCQTCQGQGWVEQTLARIVWERLVVAERLADAVGPVLSAHECVNPEWRIVQKAYAAWREQQEKGAQDELDA